MRWRTPPGVERAPGARVGRRVVLSAGRGGRIVLGPGARIGAGCELRAAPGAVIVVDGELGERCRLVARAAITVEAQARLGAQCVLGDFGPVFDDVERPTREQGLRAAPVRVAHGALLGPHVAVLAGVTVGARSVVLANSVCTADVAAGAQVAGTPARPVAGGRPAAP